MRVVQRCFEDGGPALQPTAGQFSVPPGLGLLLTNVENCKKVYQPGIEPGSVPGSASWQGTILPLDHWYPGVRDHTLLTKAGDAENIEY